jgi:hypothetical protein
MLNALFAIFNFLVVLGFYTPKLVGIYRTRHLKYKLMIHLYLLKLKLQQWWNNTTEKLDDMYILHHIIEGKLVKIIIKLNQDIHKVMKITNDDNFDITEDILPFITASPIPFTPNLVYEDRIIATLTDGTVHELVI